jgi:hypothetical protein
LNLHGLPAEPLAWIALGLALLVAVLLRRPSAPPELVAGLAELSGRLAERAGALRRHLDQARADIQGIEVSAEAIRRRAGRIAAIETENG